MKKSGSIFILVLGCAGFILGLWGLISYTGKQEEYTQILLTSDESRRQCLAEFGQTATDVPPVAQEIRLPEDDTSSQAYDTYCQLQKEQSLPLHEYAGQNAVIWTYTLENCKTHRAELICSPEGLLLGAMCYDCTKPYYMYPLIT